MAGSRIRNGSIDNALMDDERNYLFRSYCNIVKIIKPKVFIMENVKGLLHYKNGKVFKEIKNIFEKPNNYPRDQYHLSHKILESKEFGIPQSRERLFIIGVLNKKININNLFSKTKDKILNRERHFFDKVSVWDAISNLINEDETGYVSNLIYKNNYQLSLKSKHNNTFNHRKPKHKQNIINRVQQIKQGENFKKLKEDIKSVHSGAYGRLKATDISPTITTRFDTPSAGRVIHPYEDRALSPREGARIQSFSDNFCFYGNKTSIYKQIGNAVPPKLAFFLAEVVKEIIKKDN